MQQDSTLHLRELREAHTARLRVLEVQAAQLGVSCPPHVKVEIESIKKALSIIERQEGDVFLLSNSVRTGVLDWTKSLCLIKILGVILSSVAVVIIIIFLLKVLFNSAPFIISSSYGEQPNNSPRPISDVSSDSDVAADANGPPSLPNVNAVAIVCGQDVVVVFLESGLIAWKNAELDRVSLTVMPPGSKLQIRCHTSDVGEVEIILVRILVMRGNNTQAFWVIESYQCYRHPGSMLPRRSGKP